MPTHAVLLVEDDERTRQRLAEVIRDHEGLELVGSESTLAGGLEALKRAQPSVLLTDLGLPDGDGTELIRAASEAPHDVLAMAITVFGDERHVVAAIEAGALGYLLKDGTPESITGSILEMIDGGSPISSPIARYLLKRMRTSDVPDPSSGSSSDGADGLRQEEPPKLSGREQEVLRYVVKGFSYPEIAGFLEVSPHTVTTHVRGIYRKLAVHSRGEAVYEALQMGLVDLED